MIQISPQLYYCWNPAHTEVAPQLASQGSKSPLGGGIGDSDISSGKEDLVGEHGLTCFMGT